ncbi:MAG: hypothetical protein CMK89_10685 [Pseudomonadales bacterium]|nr:hypothetical protein [Pseudomonadales bacterium]
MLQRIRNFLTHATPAQRLILVVFLDSPFLLAFMAAQSAGLYVEEWRQLLVPKYIIGANFVLGGVLLVFLVTVIRLWKQRKNNTPLPKLTILVATCAGIGHACEAFLGGNLTYPTNLVIVGIIPIGILILDMRSVMIGAAVGLTFYAINDLAIYTGLLDYAPGYSAAAFVDGKHHVMAEVLRSGILYVSVIAYVLIAWVMFDQYDYHRTRLSALSKLDPLSGLANRRYFFQRVEEECERQRRTGQPLCLVMIDADHFKRINDTYGHLTGDAVLRGIAEVLTRHMRVPADLPARVGGEEFAILMPETDLDGALRVCRRVERSLQTLPFFCSGKSFTVTLSMGVVESRDLLAESLMHYADANLYKAKAQGRDTIVSSIEEEVLPRASVVTLA